MPEEQTPPSVWEDKLKYMDVKITYVEHLSVINYLTKAIEDVLIRKMDFLKFPLLLIDIPLLLATTIINVERSIYTHVIEYFLAHVQNDIQYVAKYIPFFKKKSGVLEEEEEDEEDTFEETWTGKVFQWARQFFRFLWSLIIFCIILPVWPVIKLYNYFSAIIIIGLLYSGLLFLPFVGWQGGLLYYLMFCSATFLVSSVAIPGFLRVMTYIKYLFSLERKPWREINNEAKYAFLQFYLRIQKNRQTLLDRVEPQYKEVTHVEGGVYYLILKIIYAIKDKAWNLRKKRVTDLFNKIQGQAEIITSDLAIEKKEYDKTISEMKPGELFQTSIGLLVTFGISGLIALGGSHGRGVLISIFQSFIDPVEGTTVWWNYLGSGMGYYQHLAQSVKVMPGVIKIVMTGIDYFWGYFFLAYHTILPFYAIFVREYYAFWGQVFTAIFY